ncbi:MAG TPA: glycosyltransferase family 4 protein [Thermoanaerobaculia bacterium]|jgi:hypothetical protein|nr:glycosyltransferase family 4 protein [Thermoanaerobaculia bacterium]
MSAPEPRRVLIANIAMTTASGTVTYTRDLALALLRHGWTPIVYTSVLGEQAEVLRRATIPVVSDPAQLGAPPDIIHGHHVLETLAAMARFPNVPALFVCHDSLSWHSIPPRMPRIRAYVAVDRNCRDRMVLEHGIPEDSVRVLTNPVDLQRFARRAPLPPKPRRALVFNNDAFQYSLVAPIRAACAERDIEVDVIGLASGNAVDHPEEVLERYDLVFGRARCAIEAAAMGAAVIGCDARGMSGMLTTTRLEELRLLNFGVRTLQLPLTRENLLREIDRYDPADASTVADRIRASNSADLIAEQFISLYDEILADPVRVAPEDDLAGISATLSKVGHHLYGQTEVTHPRSALLSKLLDSRILAGPLHRVYRWKKRLQSR